MQSSKEKLPARINSLTELLKADEKGTGKWIDVAGMLAPCSEIENLIQAITNGRLADLVAVSDELSRLYAVYSEHEWNWCSSLIEKRLGNKLENANKEQIKSLILEWEKSYTKLNNLILQDAMKEFDKAAKTSFGIDGDQKTIDDDFEFVRGSFEGNKFVQQVKKEILQIEAKAKELVTLIDSLE